MFVDEDLQKSTFEQSSERGSSTLHNILLEQKEKLLRNARRKKRQLRQTWFRFYFVLRKEKVVEAQRHYGNTKNRKIEGICDIAGHYCSNLLGLDQIITRIGTESKKFIAPLVNSEARQVETPTNKQLEDRTAEIYSYNFDFTNCMNIIAQDVNRMISNVTNFEIINAETDNSTHPIDDIAKEAIENMNIITAPLNMKKIEKPLSDLNQDMFIFTAFSSYEAIADGAATLAVSDIDFAGIRLGSIQNSVVPRLRPFLRLAFPRWDNEVELTIDRGDTLDPNSITSFFDTKTDTTSTTFIDGIYANEAKEMLGETQPLIDELVDELFPMVLEDEIYKEIVPEQFFGDIIEPPAVLVSRDLNQDITDSMSFIDEELHKSLVQFYGNKLGVSGVVDKLSSFQVNYFDSMLKKKVAESTFHHLSVLTPFLKGAADAKRHKMEGTDASSLTRKWKDQMMNKIREFLD